MMIPQESERAFNELDIDVLKRKGGVNLLVEFLNLKLGKHDLVDSLENFIDFEDYRRETEQSINDYISKFA